MVQNSGKTLCPGAVKPVNIPELVIVEEDKAGQPLAVRIKHRQVIRTIEDRWRIDDEWWRRERLGRLYYLVSLVSGQRLVIYKDLINSGWYRQTY